MMPGGAPTAPPPVASIPTGTPQEMDASNWGKNVAYTSQGAQPANNPGTPVAPSRGQANTPPEPYTPKPQIDLMRGKPQMQTAVGGPLPPPQNRGQQQDAMDGIKQVEDLKNKSDMVGLKMDAQEQKNMLNTLKFMKDSRKDDRDFQNKLGKLELATRGMSQEQQQFVVKQFMMAEMNTANNAARVSSARISASRPQAPRAGTDKLPSEMAVAQKQYNEARSKIQSEKSLAAQAGNDVDPKKIETFMVDQKHWKEVWNKLTKQYPKYAEMPIDEDTNPADEGGE
jgi:hypothetical protein